ncbi:MAG: hypothetical protein ABJP89_14245, partial [Lentilitoribacter sp.]
LFAHAVTHSMSASVLKMFFQNIWHTPMMDRRLLLTFIPGTCPLNSAAACFELLIHELYFRHEAIYSPWYARSEYRAQPGNT